MLASPLPAVRIIKLDGEEQLLSGLLANLLLLILQEAQDLERIERGQVVIDWAGTEPVATISRKGIRLTKAA